MSEQIDLLVQLQEIDRKRGLFKEAQERLPEDIEAARQPLNLAQEKLERSRLAMDQLTKERKAKEKDLQIAEEKLEKLKARLTELKTNKEYQAHLSEIESAKSDIGKVEEELLLLMDRGDALKGEVAEEDRRGAEAQKAFAAKKAEIESRLEDLRSVAASLEGQETGLLQKIDPKLLQEYRQLGTLHKGMAVVPLQNGTCSGCHFSLPPQLATEVKKREKVLTCSYCRRILYWPKVPSPTP